MNKLYIIMLFLSSVVSPISAQLLVHEWSNHLVGSPYSAIAENTLTQFKMDVDVQGNVLSIGTYSKIDSYQGSDQSSFFIKKSDVSGELQWIKTIGGADTSTKVRAIDVRTDLEGHVYVLGFLKGAIDLDPALGEEIIGLDLDLSLRTVFLAKYSTSGDFLWSWSYSGTAASSFVRGQALAINPLDNSVTLSLDYYSPIEIDINPGGSGGLLPGIGSAHHSFLLNVSQGGDFQWLKELGSEGIGYSNVSSSLLYDEEGRLTVTGWTSSAFTVDGQLVGIYGQSSLFLLRFEEGNDTEILHEFSSFGINPFNSPLDFSWDQPIVLLQKGEDIWLSGLVVDDFTVDGQLLEKTSDLSSSVFVLKVDPGAEDLVLFEIPSCEGDYRHTISGNEGDMIILKGRFSGSRDFDWSSDEEHILSASSNTFSPFIMGVSTEGEFIFAEQIDVSSYAYLLDVQYMGEDKYVFSGASSGEIDLGFNLDTSIVYQSEHLSGVEFQLFNPLLEAICKDTIVVEIDKDGVFNLTAEMLNDGSSANYESDLIFTINQDEVYGQGFHEGQYVVLEVEEPLTGTKRTCESYIITSDNLLPVALCKDLTVSLYEDGLRGISPAEVDAGSFDNFLLDTRFLSQNTFDCADLGPNKVILTVIDAGGLSASCESVVTVIDDLAPVLECADLEVFLDETGAIQDEDLVVQGLISDNCEIADYGLLFEGDPCYPDPSGFSAELMALDNSGNRNSCLLNVVVLDRFGPIVKCKKRSFWLQDEEEEILLNQDLLVYELWDNCTVEELSFSPELLGIDHIGNNTVLVEAVDSHGNSSSCIAEVYLSIPLNDEELVYVPNVFSPNNDGVNDQLAVFSSKKVVRITQFTILDRWGNIHYEEQDSPPVNSGLGWNGQLDGDDAPEGVYLYKLRVLAVNGKYYDFSGTFFLM